MTKHDGGPGARHVRLADLPRATIGDHIWHPLRRALGATGFGVGVYSAETAGDVLVGTHDETSSSSNRHEELYVVLAGRARFSIDDDVLELGPEEFLLVDAGARRGATALVDGTSVLIVGGAPGTVTAAPYEHWYTALSADTPAGMAEIAAGGLIDYPEHGQLNYQLACFRALAGQLDEAATHLRRAVATDERAWEWLADDTDLDSLRSRAGAIPIRTEVGGLYVEQAGAGSDIVLLHAGIADSRMWNPQWATWAHGHRVTRLDLRGYGRSAAPQGEYCPAGDVLAALDALDIGRAVLVGASFGGLVALDLACANPDRVNGLVLADAPLPGYSWSAEMKAYSDTEEAMFAARDLLGAAQLNVDFWLGSASEATRSAIFEQQLRASELQVDAEADDVLLTDDLLGQLGTIDVPVLVVVGESDIRDFHDIADRLVAEIPKAERVTIPEACHLPSLEHPAVFDAAVLPFIERAQ